MNSSWTVYFRHPLRKAVLGIVLPVLAVVGCGPATAKVGGKVTFNGQPVTGGRLTFTPVPHANEPAPGAPSSVEVQPDGRYTLGSQGALVGRQRVYYAAPAAAWPPGVEPTPSVSPPLSPFEGAVPKTNEVEVKPGANTIDIELVNPSPR